MGEPYVTIGGKQVHPRPPASAVVHPTHQSPVTWEEGWQRETTRVSVPVGSVVLVAVMVLILVRLLQNRRSRSRTPRS